MADTGPGFILALEIDLIPDRAAVAGSGELHGAKVARTVLGHSWPFGLSFRAAMVKDSRRRSDLCVSGGECK